MKNKAVKTSNRFTEFWRKMTGRVNLDDFCPTVFYDEPDDTAAAKA